MDSDILHHLKALHTSAIDARNGYQEALKDAEGKGMSPLFREMIALHADHASELGRELAKAGETPEKAGEQAPKTQPTEVRILTSGTIKLLAEADLTLAARLPKKWPDLAEFLSE